MGDAQLARTPIPVPAYFQQAEESFSLKRRWRPASQNLTPRPPVKTALPVSRVYPRRQLAWSHPRPRSVSSKGLAAVRLSSRVYDESKEDPYFEQCFQKISRLGRGSFGEVFKVRSREDGRLYAVKRSMELFRGEADRARKLAEAHRHESLGPHANLVRFVHAWEERRRLYIQTELCGASLQQYAERRAPLPERQVWAVLTDLARALKHLHDRGLAHLDVKPANVFVCGRGGARHCKLGDFGLLADLGAGGHGEAQEGDPAYMAPELLDGVYSTSADVFSLGMTILEICCNLELPRSGEAWQRLRQGDLPREFVAGLSSDLLEVLRAMLQPDFRQRISVDNLLALPALRKAQRWRGVETLLHSGISWTLALYRCLLSIMCSLWRAVSRPVTQLLLRQRHSCPASPLPSRALDAELYNDWEDSSLMNASEGPDEDDEVFGRPSKAEPLTVTLSPLHRLPEPSGHSNGKLFPEEISSRLSMGSTSTPRQTSDTQGSAMNGSPNLSRISQDSPCRGFSPSSRPFGIQEDGQAPGAAPFVPRNLLSLFDESMECG